MTHEWPHAVEEAAQAAAATCAGLLAVRTRGNLVGGNIEELSGPAPLASPARPTTQAPPAVVSPPDHPGSPGSPAPALSTAGRRHRRPRQAISIALKKKILRLRDSGVTWAVVLQQLSSPVSMNTAVSIMRSADHIRALPSDPRTMARVNRRGSKWPMLDAMLYKWYIALYSLGHRRIPITTAMLQEAATMIAERLSIGNFAASHGFVRGFLARHDICNVAMHGQAGAVNLAKAAAAVEEVRRKLEGYNPDRIYNMDETGLQYRCLPSRSYVPRKDRKRARGSKSMSSKDCVTLVLCTNADASHKLPVAMIGSAASPLCFRGAGNACPLPYFSQKSAWMDHHV